MFSVLELACPDPRRRASSGFSISAEPSLVRLEDIVGVNWPTKGKKGVRALIEARAYV